MQRLVWEHSSWLFCSSCFSPTYTSRYVTMTWGPPVPSYPKQTKERRRLSPKPSRSGSVRRGAQSLRGCWRYSISSASASCSCSSAATFVCASAPSLGARLVCSSTRGKGDEEGARENTYIDDDRDFSSQCDKEQGDFSSQCDGEQGDFSSECDQRTRRFLFSV